MSTSQRTTPCPDASRGELPRDCPWIELAETLADVDESAVAARLAAKMPTLGTALATDARQPMLTQLWARSLNRDENTGEIIVAPNILGALCARLGDSLRDEVTPAGIAHTYGYLFSLIRTPYGFKRDRWLDGKIAAGFALPADTFSPSPARGTLLGNVTYFAASLALADNSAARTFVASKIDVPDALRTFDYGRLVVRRLTEAVAVEVGKSKVEITLRLDVVTFPSADKPPGRLVVYSVADPRLPHGAALITLFSVDAAFAEGLFAAAELGESRPIRARYNAYVPGLTEAGSLRGRRAEVVWPGAARRAPGR